MKKTNNSFKFILLVMLITLCISSLYAQTTNRTGTVKNPEWGKIRDWLNGNPAQAKEGEKEKEGKNCNKFEYKLLELDKPAPLPDLPEEPLSSPCISVMIAPIKPVPDPKFKGRDFEGTVYDPMGPQPVEDKFGVKGQTLYLFNSETGKLEAKTTINQGGSYRFAQIPEGKKSLFYRSKKGNLIYADSVRVCGRGVDKDGKGCAR